MKSIIKLISKKKKIQEGNKRYRNYILIMNLGEYQMKLNKTMIKEVGGADEGGK